MFARGVPSICYGLRGLVYFQIDLRGSNTDLHSGVFGGALANPAFVLAQMIAQMKDRSGRIKIPGFYDDVVALQDAERQAWATLPFNEKQYREEFGIPKLHGEPGFTTLERVWARPTLRSERPALGVHRRRGQDGLPGNRDGQDQHAPRAESASRHDRARSSRTTCKNRAEDRRGDGDADARRQTVDGAFDSTYIQAAGRAIEQGFGRTPVFTREGGSIPVVATFQEELGLPSVLFGVGLPDENAHAPNEKLDVGNFHNGIIASAALYHEIGRL